MKIGLLGATGYTGRLVAAELDRRDVQVRLGGRSEQRLAQVPGSGERILVDLAGPSSLASFMTGLDALISCAGPFAEIGDLVVDAAVRAGVPYLDSTGEPDFISAVLDRHAGAATPVVPCCGFDYLPGDLAVKLAAAALKSPAEDVLVGYQITGMRPTRGTARSAAGALGTAAARPVPERLAFPDREVPALVLPWGEEVLVPRYLPGARVRSAIAVPAMVGRIAPMLATGFTLIAPLRPQLAGLLRRGADRMAEGPTLEVRGKARFRVLATVSGAGQRSQVLVEGSDVYLTTALLLVEAALRLPDAPAGAQTPAQALDPESFLDAVSGELLSWRRV